MKQQDDATYVDECLWVLVVFISTVLVGYVAAVVLEIMKAPQWAIVPLILFCATTMGLLIRRGPPA